MADITVSSANTVEQWSERFFYEYNRASQFARYEGKTENSPFQIVSDLEAMPGKTVTVSFITTPTNSGVAGDATLRGNEPNLGNYGHAITIDQLRNACSVGRAEQKKTHLDLLKATSVVMKNWATNKKRADCIEALMSPNLDGSTAYASTAEGDKDLWVTAQYAANRVLFGAAKSNYSAADHSASLLNIDSAGDVLTPAMVSLAKRMAKSASHKMRPISVDGDGEWFVLLCNTFAFRDFKTAATMLGPLEYAGVRGDKNPLFTDSSIKWDGVIVTEVEEIPVITGVGAGAIDVAPNFLIGAQALGIAYGEPLHAIKDSVDYENITGVGVAEMRGIDKLMFNNIQNGVLTLYTAGVADT